MSTSPSGARPGQYDGDRASPITWLAMIARNKSIDRLRTGRVDRAAVPIVLARSWPTKARGRGPGGSRLRRQAASRLPGRIERRAAPRYRVAFFEGCTYEEIAERSATALGTIKSWIRRGLIKLKDCLQR